MPLYEFKRPDGKRVEAIAPSGCLSLVIDGVTCQRDQTPARIAIGGLNRGEGGPEDQIRKGYYKLEQKGGRWPSKFSKTQIKRILETA